MAIRTALLNWNNITRDTDFSKYIETVSEPWVIQGLVVSSTKVGVWKAWVPCERTNGETIYALVYNTSEVSISWNGDVFIQVSQTYIDDGELANEDGTGIATIQVGTMPSKNALKLAEKSWSTITDARNMIVKVGELNTYIQSLNTRMNIAEQKIDEIIEDSAVDHLEETGLVGELYTLSNTLFKQDTPTLANSTVDANIGDTNDNYKIHIQRIASWTASNKLKLKVKKVWSPTTWLVVEVKRWVQVDVSTTEAYWYGNELVCSWSIAYTAIDTTYSEIEVTLNGQFGWTKGELLDIVVYQTWNVVNSSNYYAIACDSTQYSEWFSYVAEDNSSTYTRSKLMPYCIGNGFAQSLLAKSLGDGKFIYNLSRTAKGNGSYTWTETHTLDKSYPKAYVNASWPYEHTLTVTVNSTQVYTSWSVFGDLSYTFTPSSWDVVVVSHTVWLRNDAYHTWNDSLSVAENTWRKLIPAEVVEIGEIGVGISYWKLPDWKRYGDFFEDISNTATTWSISLGNCVGFMPVIWPDGVKYKIPIYWV